MKQQLFLISSMIFLLLFSGCSSQKEDINSMNSYHESSVQIDDLHQIVQTYIQKVKNTQSQKNDYFSLKKEGELIEEQIDQKDDEIEKQYKDGLLSQKEYQSLEKELETLEDQLENVQDQLDFLFDID